MSSPLHALRVACLMALAFAGCAPNLVLDGETFEVASCASGQAGGFRGVDLTDARGRRITVAWTAAGGALVHVEETPGEANAALGRCAEIAVDITEEPGEPYFVSGSLTARCDAAGHTLTGGYTFERCR